MRNESVWFAATPVRYAKFVLNSLFVLITLLMMPQQGRAAVITIDDITSNIVISWSGFRDFNVAGVPYSVSNGSVSLAESIDLATGLPRLFAFAGHFDSPGGNHFAQSFDNVFYIRDVGGRISDVLQVGFDVDGNTTLVSGVFGSAVDGFPSWSKTFLDNTFTTPPAQFVDEAAIIDFTSLLRTPLPPGFTSLIVNLGTDETSSAAPEPGTLALLGFGLAGVALRNRRRGITT